MRKAVALATILVTLTAGSCGRGSKPNPKPNKTYQVPAGAYARLCMEPAFMQREKDSVCENATPRRAWIWVSASSMFPKELPAVGEQLKANWGIWYEPQGVTIVAIPDEGAYFQ